VPLAPAIGAEGYVIAGGEVFLELEVSNAEKTRGN
jgi:hypothetical protein